MMDMRTKILTGLAVAGALGIGMTSEVHADMCDDGDAPNVTVDPSETELEIDAGEPLSLSVTADDSGPCASGLDEVYVWINDMACEDLRQDLDGELTLETTFELNLPPGEHTIEVLARDRTEWNGAGAAPLITVTVSGEGSGEYSCGLMGPAGDGDGDGGGDGDAGAGEAGDGDEDGSGCRVPSRGLKPALAWVLAIGAGSLLARRRRRKQADGA